MKIQIQVNVSVQAASKSGSIEHGNLLVEPTSVQWQAASVDQREALARYVHPASQKDQWRWDCTLDTIAPTWEAVVGRIAELADEAAAKKAAAEAEAARLDREAETALPRVVEALLARPIEDWIQGAYYLFAPQVPTVTVDYKIVDRVRRLMDGHADIADRLKEARAEGQRRLAEHKAAEAQKEASEAAAKAAAKADAKSFVDSAKKFALTIDDLARASADGYDVVGAVLDHVAEQISNVPGDLQNDAIVLREGTRAYDAWGWSQRKAPRAPAFRALDEIEAHIQTVALPDGATIEIGSICRGERDADDDRESYKATVIPVTLSAPGQKDRVVLFDLESVTADAE